MKKLLETSKHLSCTVGNLAGPLVGLIKLPKEMRSDLLSGGRSSICQAQALRKEAVWSGGKIAQYFASYMCIVT